MATYRPAEVGMPLSEVDTPSLILDLDAFERNLDRMDASNASRSRISDGVSTSERGIPTSAGR